jgi:phospholipid/cholesterol/gamma-HCH transport system permease protein
MVRSVADRAFLPAKNLLEEVGDMMILTGKTIVSALRPPYPYGGEFVSQFLFALRLCWFPLLISTVAFGYAPLGPFFATFLTNASITDLWGSVLKCTLFGAIIAIVCCYKGMTASGGAQGVGRAVNQAVVIAFLGVFAFNYVFTQTLLATHPEITVIK